MKNTFKFKYKKWLVTAICAGMILPALSACGNATNASTAVEEADEKLLDVEVIKEAAIGAANVAEPVFMPPYTDRLTPKTRVHGIYVPPHMAGGEKVDDLIELTTTTPVNAFVIDIKDDNGNLTYTMENDKVNEYEVVAPYISDIKGVIDKLHENDIYVIARIVCFKDPALAKVRPELAICDKEGNPVKDSIDAVWVNPFNEEVWEYLAGIAKQASDDGFDEIQFDYIRFPVDKVFDEADWGVDLNNDTKQECITNFLAYLEKELHPEGIVFGTDVFGATINAADDSSATGQNYIQISQAADVLSPMIYPSHYWKGAFGLDVPDAAPYETIYGACSLSVDVLKDMDPDQTSIIRPWLQCFSAAWVEGHIKYDFKAIQAQIDAVYDAGYEEWILWNAVGRYTDVIGVH